MPQQAVSEMGVGLPQPAYRSRLQTAVSGFGYQAEYVMRGISERFRQCGLEIHPDKSSIVYYKDAIHHGQIVWTAVSVDRPPDINKKMKETGVVTQLIRMKGKDHGWKGWRAQINLVVDWFDEHL